MLQLHGFFIPDQDYLIDTPGLLKQLFIKIHHQNICLYCDQNFSHLADHIIDASSQPKEAKLNRKALEANRKHMNDKARSYLNQMPPSIDLYSTVPLQNSMGK